MWTDEWKGGREGKDRGSAIRNICIISVRFVCVRWTGWLASGESAFFFFFSFSSLHAVWAGQIKARRGRKGKARHNGGKARRGRMSVDGLVDGLKHNAESKEW